MEREQKFAVKGLLLLAILLCGMWVGRATASSLWVWIPSLEWHVSLDVNYLVDLQILVCRGSTLLPGDADEDCSDGGWLYVPFSEVMAEDLISTNGGPFVSGADILQEYEIAGGGFSSGGGGGDPDEDFSFDDIDLETAGQHFAVGFSLVAIFWALGKGIGLALALIRR